MEFINVTDVTIPEGNVTRITETDSGRVLWEREVFEEGYPRFVTTYKCSDGTLWRSDFFSANNDSGYQIYGKNKIHIIPLTDLVYQYYLARSYKHRYWNAMYYHTFASYTSDNISTHILPKVASVGDEITSLCVKNNSEQDNWGTQAHSCYSLSFGNSLSISSPSPDNSKDVFFKTPDYVDVDVDVNIGSMLFYFLPQDFEASSSALERFNWLYDKDGLMYTETNIANIPYKVKVRVLEGFYPKNSVFLSSIYWSKIKILSFDITGLIEYVRNAVNEKYYQVKKTEFPYIRWSAYLLRLSYPTFKISSSRVSTPAGYNPFVFEVIIPR